jgi:hypothetical protein
MHAIHNLYELKSGSGIIQELSPKVSWHEEQIPFG